MVRLTVTEARHEDVGHQRVRLDDIALFSSKKGWDTQFTEDSYRDTFAFVCLEEKPKPNNKLIIAKV